MNQDIAVFLVPMLLGIGSILATAGGLYFIDIKFLKSRSQAIASLLGGLLVFAVLEILLYGSAAAFFNAQQLQTSDCELQGEAANPNARRGGNPQVLHDAIVACMKQAGYVWTADHPHCRDASVATNPFCYLPDGGLERTITNLQMKLQ